MKKPRKLLRRGAPAPSSDWRCNQIDRERGAHGSIGEHRCVLDTGHVGRHFCVCGEVWFADAPTQRPPLAEEARS